MKRSIYYKISDQVVLSLLRTIRRSSNIYINIHTGGMHWETWHTDDQLTLLKVCLSFDNFILTLLILLVLPIFLTLHKHHNMDEKYTGCSQLQLYYFWRTQFESMRGIINKKYNLKRIFQVIRQFFDRFFLSIFFLLQLNSFEYVWDCLLFRKIKK